MCLLVWELVQIGLKLSTGGDLGCVAPQSYGYGLMLMLSIAHVSVQERLKYFMSFEKWLFDSVAVTGLSLSHKPDFNKSISNIRIGIWNIWHNYIMDINDVLFNNKCDPFNVAQFYSLIPIKWGILAVCSLLAIDHQCVCRRRILI